MIEEVQRLGLDLADRTGQNSREQQGSQYD